MKFVKETFTPHFDTNTLDQVAIKRIFPVHKQNKDFFFQMNEYIKSKVGFVAPSTLHVFNNLKVVLQSFQAYRKRPIIFSEIDINFYDEFLHYLSFEHIHKNKNEVTKGLKMNTVVKNIKQLIIFLKNRNQKNIVLNLDTTGFKIPEEEADAIYLTTEEIKQIIAVR